MPGLHDVATLNTFLADKSYIEGYQKSAADAVVFQALGAQPDGKKFVHAARWYNHIASFGDKINAFPGTKKDINSYGPANGATMNAGAAAPQKKEQPKKEEKEDEDDIDLFGSDEEEDAEAEELKKKRVAEYEAKKSTKPVLIAKSSILLDVKPWDDQTDMAALEAGVRAIQCDGLLWGASKLLPVAYGIKKLQILCTVEDDKVGTDYLEENILALEDYVQSMDVVAFNKI